MSDANFMESQKESRDWTKVICYFEYSFKQKVATIHLHTEDGQMIPIQLLDSQTLNMQNGTTLILGKSYDIFS
ncbi:hypothetical protein [Laceyella putida]|uniref:Uncharacterized protein n=1 Tax=Laceyella putida TaxID=110101 RepID=A0ABW2RP83_9BACL